MPDKLPTYLKWEIPEYRRPNRGRHWYTGAGIFIFICLFFSFFAFQGWKPVFLGAGSNFLFALIIVIAAIIMIVKENQEPIMIDFELGPEGVTLSGRFHDYDEFKNFSVLYKPKQSLKNLYLEYKNSLKPRLSIPLRRMDALTVRNFLVRYLDEDLDRLHPPLSEQLTKMLKL